MRIVCYHWRHSYPWYSSHHQPNHHFFNRSKCACVDLPGACTETSAPDFVCHQKLLTAEIQDQERTKDPNKKVSQRFGIYRQISSMFNKNSMRTLVVIWFNGSMMVQDYIIVFARNYYPKWTEEKETTIVGPSITSFLQWCPCTYSVCKKNTTFTERDLV